MAGLVRLSLRYRTAMLLVAGLVALAGVFIAAQAPREFLPPFDMPSLVVRAAQPGAAPDTIATTLARPIEEVVRATAGVRHVDSTSLEGRTVVTAQYDYGTPMGDREREVRERLTAAPLPKGVAQPSVQRLSPDTRPVYGLAVAGVDPVAAERWVDTRLRPGIESLGGVATVGKAGGSANVVSIVADQRKLAAVGYVTGDITEALQSANLSVSAGGLATEGRQLPVLVEASTHTLEQIRSLPLGPVRVEAAPGEPPAQPPVIGGVATVTYDDHGVGATIARADGEPAIFLDVHKDQNANTVEVVDRLEGLLATTPPPKSVTIRTLSNQAPVVNDALGGLGRDVLAGIAVAVVALFVALRRPRTALAAALAIPLTALGAVVALRAGQWTVNTLTLVALGLAVGRAAHSAILMIEAMDQRMSTGLSRSEAVDAGASDARPVITASTVAAAIVLLPFGLAGGLVGRLWAGFALTLGVALLVSLVVSVTVVPILADLWLSARPAAAGASRAGAPSFSAPWGGLGRAYGRWLNWSLDKRTLMAAVAGGLAVAAGAGSLGLAGNLLPAEKTHRLAVTLTTPPGTSLVATAERIAPVSDLIRALPGVAHVNMVTGAADSPSAGVRGMTSGPNSAVLTVELAAGADFDELAGEIEALIPKAGVEGAVGEVGSDHDRSELVVSVTGDTVATLAAASKQVAEALDGVAGLGHVSESVAAEQLRLGVEINPAEARARGLDPRAVANSVQSVVDPAPVTSVLIDGIERPVMVQADETANAFTEDLSTLVVAPGVRLGDIGEVRMLRSPALVHRHDGRRSVVVRAAVTGPDADAVIERTQAALAGLPRLPGVVTDLGGLNDLQAGARSDSGKAVALAVALLFVALVACFRNLTTALMALVSLPLAAVGAVAALLITGRSLDLPALAGVLVLTGLAVTAAVSVLAEAERLQRDGVAIRESLLLAGPASLGPLLLSVACTVGAILPLAFGLSDGARLAAGLVTVVIGGLITSTLFGLLLLPAVYTFAAGARVRTVERWAVKAEAARAPKPPREPDEPWLRQDGATGKPYLRVVPPPPADPEVDASDAEPDSDISIPEPIAVNGDLYTAAPPTTSERFAPPDALAPPKGGGTPPETVDPPVVENPADAPPASAATAAELVITAGEFEGAPTGPVMSAAEVAAAPTEPVMSAAEPAAAELNVPPVSESVWARPVETEAETVEMEPSPSPEPAVAALPAEVETPAASEPQAEVEPEDEDDGSWLIGGEVVLDDPSPTDPGQPTEIYLYEEDEIAAFTATSWPAPPATEQP